MRLESLPQPTIYDPAEDPPGSVDPLGTVPGAEQLADVLFPGMTARMWRARHLTFAAVAAFVAGEIFRQMPDVELSRLEARLAFERLFVAAIARLELRGDGAEAASRQLPGIRLARQARDANNRPLGCKNFLKGQANGPFGVVARLARDMDLIDDEEQLSPNGESLLDALSEDHELQSLIDDNGSNSSKWRWLRDVIGKVVEAIENDASWPKESCRGGASWLSNCVRTRSE